MAKINYTKVEEAIEKLYLEALVQRLYNVSKIFEDFGSSSTLSAPPLPDKEAVSSALNQINELITKIKATQPEKFSKLKLNKNNLRRMIRNPEKITTEDWNEIKALRIQAMQFLSDTQSNDPNEINENLIEKEKKIHHNKRFNVRDKWWPV